MTDMRCAVLALVACSSGPAPASHADAASSHADGPYCSPGCFPTNDVTVVCSGSTVTLTRPQRPINPMYCCTEGPLVMTSTCANGCAVQGAAIFTLPLWLSYDGFCSGAREAQPGDACGSAPCFPTRAQLGSDGTVVSETYLECDTAAQTCGSASAPDLPRYLSACDAFTIAHYGTANAVGVVADDNLTAGSACLIAWDAANSRPTSGITKRCIGDWQCPAGSLCDDGIQRLVATTYPVAVCKPGPRGVLTSAMLSP